MRCKWRVFAFLESRDTTCRVPTSGAVIARLIFWLVSRTFYNKIIGLPNCSLRASYFLTRATDFRLKEYRFSQSQFARVLLSDACHGLLIQYCRFNQSEIRNPKSKIPFFAVCARLTIWRMPRTLLQSCRFTQSEIRNPKSAIRNRKSDVGGQKSEIGDHSEIRNRKSDVGGQKSEIGSHSEIQNPKSKIRNPQSFFPVYHPPSFCLLL